MSNGPQQSGTGGPFAKAEAGKSLALYLARFYEKLRIFEPHPVSPSS